MKYLIVQDWKSTHGNHAGMVHMCNLLFQNYPNEYRVIIKEYPSPFIGKHINNKIIEFVYNIIIKPISKFFHYWKQRRSFLSQYLDLCQNMLENLENEDEIFLLEYNLSDVPQMGLARYLKENYPYIHIYALSHLTPSNISKKYKSSYILKNDKYVDRELTLGSSLSDYYASIGIKAEKISTGFHYVDNVYYSLNKSLFIRNGKTTVISMGALQRNYNLLSLIVNELPEINWIICRGRNESIDTLFAKNNNVRLNGFLSEDDLREEMLRSDISINVLDDTVGSNVITTSMSMGLAIVVSDVGSIRDYCDESNAVFCRNNVESFVEAIRGISVNKERLELMRLSSIEKSKDFQIENIHKWFISLKN